MSINPQLGRSRATGSHAASPKFKSADERQGLTPREGDVWFWVSEGKRDREIATILGISVRTVEKHVCRILEKLGVETRTAAANEHYKTFTGTKTEMRNKDFP